MAKRVYQPALPLEAVIPSCAPMAAPKYTNVLDVVPARPFLFRVLPPVSWGGDGPLDDLHFDWWTLGRVWGTPGIGEFETEEVWARADRFLREFGGFRRSASFCDLSDPFFASLVFGPLAMFGRDLHACAYWSVAHHPLPEPLFIEGSVADYAGMLAVADSISPTLHGPDYVWLSDGSWVLGDFLDSPAGYLAAEKDVGEAILAVRSPVFLRVDPQAPYVG